MRGLLVKCFFLLRHDVGVFPPSSGGSVVEMSSLAATLPVVLRDVSSVVPCLSWRGKHEVFCGPVLFHKL